MSKPPFFRPNEVSLGSCSKSYYWNPYFIKTVHKDFIPEHTVFERELHALYMIKDFEWAPKVVMVMPDQKIIFMKDAGRLMSKHTCPDDFEDQLRTICNDLKRIGLRHDDLKFGNLVVNNEGKITLVDWGYCSKITFKEGVEPQDMTIDDVSLVERDGTLGGCEGVSEFLSDWNKGAPLSGLIRQINKLRRGERIRY